MAKEQRPKNAPLYTPEELELQRPAILLGVQQYNDGYFFEAHETWEDIWYRCPLPTRMFLQGLIQTAAAFVHLVRREYPGTVRLLGHALAKLEDFPPEYLDFDVVPLREAVRRARDELAALGPERFEEWDSNGVPRIRMIERPGGWRSSRTGN